MAAKLDGLGIGRRTHGAFLAVGFKHPYLLLAGMAEDPEQSDPTQSAAVGTVREGLRTLAPLLGRDPDEAAAEVDRVIESVTPPGASAEDVDAAVGAVFRSAQARRNQPESTRREPMVRSVKSDDGNDRIIVDYGPSDVSAEVTDGAVFVTVHPADDYTERFDFPDATEVHEVETEAGGMATFEVATGTPDTQDTEPLHEDVDRIGDEDADPPSEEAESVAGAFESDDEK